VLIRGRSWLVFVLCLAPRIAALWWFPPDTSVYYYWEASGAVLDSASYLEPLYPALLACLRFLTRESLTLVLFGQAAIAAAGGVLLHRLTADLVNARAAAIAAALYAFDPYLVRQSVSLVEITLCTVLLIAAGRAFARRESLRDSMFAGVWVALAGLTRFSLLPVAAGTIGVLLWRRRFAHAAAFAAAVVALVGGWIGWTYATTRTIVPARIGINLFVSTSEYSGEVRDVDVLVAWAHEVIAHEMPREPLPEADLDRIQDEILLRRALAFAREHPMKTARLKLTNLALSLSPVLLPLDYKTRDATAVVEGGRVRVTALEPRPRSDRLIYSASRTILLAGACAGLVLRRRRWKPADAYVLVVAASVVLVCTVFFPTSRLLAPMAFVLMVYTAIAVDTLMARAR